MSHRDPDDGDGKTVRRRVDADLGFEPTSVRGSSPAPPEPGAEHTSIRRVTSDSDPLIGQMLGEYRVLAPLGEGGMGLVYRGEQPVIGRGVAIKVLKREYAQDPTHARRFLEEARSLSAARHPGIIDVFSFGQTPAGEPYLVMELLEGEPMDALLKRRGSLTAKETIDLLIPMLNALGAAHAAGVIHRDLKPGNVFVVKLHDGTTFPKLLDFGLARRGEAGAFVRQTSVGGTPLYIAPEQARGESVGPQTDLYSLGCLAYELLSGRPPFFEGNLHELIDAHLTLAPKPLRPQLSGVSAALERFVLQLLEKDAAMRPASAIAAREQLERMKEQAVAPTRIKPALRPLKNEKTEQPAVTERTPVLRDREPAATTASLPAQRPRAPWPFVAGGALFFLVIAAVVAMLAVPTAQTTPPPVTPIPIAEPASEPALDEEPEPVDVATPEPAVEPVKPRVPKGSRHTARDVKQRWRALHEQSNTLPEDLRRAVRLQLDEARFCTAAPEQCWRDLSDLEQTYFHR